MNKAVAVIGVTFVVFGIAFMWSGGFARNSSAMLSGFYVFVFGILLGFISLFLPQDLRTLRPPSFKLLSIVILLIAVVEVTNYLIPAPTSGSVTITDEPGVTWGGGPNIPFLDIVEATIEKNQTTFTARMKVNGDIPSQTESLIWGDATYRYWFGSSVSLELNGNKWTPTIWGEGGYMGGPPVLYSGEDFPGSFLIDNGSRTVTMMVDLNFLRERGVSKDFTSEAFVWRASTSYSGPMGSGGIDSTSDAYFPDYLSVQRPTIHTLTLILIVLSGVFWWLGASIWKDRRLKTKVHT